ncbi:MAG TPA: M18 family aminopeptidase, partial [Methylococcaceae bacterium]|nr:M18 family aminopeptidase [Methylococcaceae bacterium]
MHPLPTAHETAHAQALLHYIDQSPSPWHAVDTTKTHLEAAGYLPLAERDLWKISPGARHYVIRGDSSIIAFRQGTLPPSEAGFRILGAHTDSPGLRIKPHGHLREGRLVRLGVEVYGGPILASFSDRDLSLAGRVSIKGERGIESRLVRFESPLLRLPNLAIHMNRSVNEEGLKFNKQTELPLILGQMLPEAPSQTLLYDLIAERLKVESSSILSLELNVHETQPGTLWGAHSEFLASRQIDNLSSCHAALSALLSGAESPMTQVIALFDHEEIGSESHQGAQGSFLSDVLSRLAGGDTENERRALARTLLVSADAAHAFHPSFSSAYEPLHHVQINEGPALKINANQRYAT